LDDGTVNPMGESDNSGNLTAEFISFGGARIAMLTLSAGTVNYYVSDHLGSSHVVTNSSGTILDDSDFYPYGGERSYSSSSGNTRKFTGKERDSESGLDDFAARFYTSNYGRFLSADDAKYVKTADPQSWNLYGYVANNPINSADPTGHAPESFGRHMPLPMEGGGSLDGGASSGFSSDESGSDTKTYIISVTINGTIEPNQDIQATNASDAISAAVSVGESAGGTGTDFAGAAKIYQDDASSITKMKFSKKLQKIFTQLGTTADAVRAGAANMDIENGVGSTDLVASLYANTPISASANTEFGNKTIGEYMAAHPGTIAISDLNGNRTFLNSSLIDPKDSWFNKGNTLHEVLHHVTHLTDSDIQRTLGLKEGPSANITQRILQKW